jgi:hypothetical protein
MKLLNYTNGDTQFWVEYNDNEVTVECVYTLDINERGNGTCQLSRYTGELPHEQLEAAIVEAVDWGQWMHDNTFESMYDEFGDQD